MPPSAASLEEFSGARLLFADARIALMLLREAHYSALHKVFGTTREQSTLVTIVLSMLIAQAARDSVVHSMQGVGGATWGDTAIGAAAVKESLHLIAGPKSREVPLGTIVALALVARLSVPVVRQSAHSIRVSSSRVHGAFQHRYGHLVHTSRHHYGRLREKAAAGVAASGLRTD